MTVEFDEEKQHLKLDEIRRQEEENLTKILSKKYGLPYLDLNIAPIDIDALRIIREQDAREAGAGVFDAIDKRIKVAVASPQNEKAQALIKNLTEQGYQIDLYLVSKASLEKVWQRYEDLSYSFETKSGSLDISNEEIVNFIKEVKTLDDIKTAIDKILNLKKSYRISRIVEVILAGAIATDSSDIHIEPEEKNVRLRYRLDGVLTDILHFDLETFKLLLSRIKLLSRLKLNTKGMAQDGRFSIKVGQDEIEIRTSILPGAYDESVVLRVLNPNAISVPFEKLGIHPRLLEILEREIKKPNGMILTTGPTGSGKTTTLYAFLKKIHQPSVKIITIENPIEYHLPGIVQTQTDPKNNYTFLEGLRSALRQDPDVIMVGEIRDEETAEIAINAALTGHLVFSTLHTNNAAGSFPRLIDLGVNPKIISSAINISLAQRLVRKLCDQCKQAVPLDEKAKQIIDNVLRTINDKSYLENIQREQMWVAAGCSECNGSGFRSRIGIFEGILTDKTIEDIVVQNPSEREIGVVAKKQNILTMAQDGILKVLGGITALEELARVVELD